MSLIFPGSVFMISLFYTTLENNSFLNQGCCQNAVERYMHLGNHLVYEVIDHNVLPWWLFCHLLFNFFATSLNFYIVQSGLLIYIYTFLSVYSVTEIPQKHLRKPFVAYNWITYISIHQYFYLLILIVPL